VDLRREGLNPKKGTESAHRPGRTVQIMRRFSTSTIEKDPHTTNIADPPSYYSRDPISFRSNVSLIYEWKIFFSEQSNRPELYDAQAEVPLMTTVYMTVLLGISWQSIDAIGEPHKSCWENVQIIVLFPFST
jgi:hypothetical protein